MFFIFLIYINFHCWSSCSHQQITIFYTKDNKRLLMNLFQGQFVPLHNVSLLCIILDEKCTPIYANGRFLVLFFSPRNACISTVYHSTRKMHAHLRERKISCSFFSPRKKIYDRHVNGLGDLPFISLVCNRARSLKKNMFHTISNLGEKHRHSLKMKTCKSTCSTFTVVSHS